MKQKPFTLAVQPDMFQVWVNGKIMIQNGQFTTMEQARQYAIAYSANSQQTTFLNLVKGEGFTFKNGMQVAQFTF